MVKIRLIIISFALSWALYGCGAKPAMEGGQSDSSTEVGSVSEGGSGTADGATGNGDTTSFGDDNAEKVDEYVVRRGDNLWNIAAKGSVYRSGWLYPLILKANRNKIKNARDLKVGLTLKVPRGLPHADYDVAREEAMAGVFESEVGPLQEMKTDVPTAAAPLSDEQKSKLAAAASAKRGGWKKLLWLALLALAAWAGWKFWRMRKESAEGADKSPDTKEQE